jgi:hypothetical protein
MITPHDKRAQRKRQAGAGNQWEERNGAIQSCFGSDNPCLGRREHSRPQIVDAALFPAPANFFFGAARKDGEIYGIDAREMTKGNLL